MEHEADSLDRAAEEADSGSPYNLSDVLANQMIEAADARLRELIPQYVLPEIGPEGCQSEDRLRYIKAMNSMVGAIAEAAAVIADVIRE